ISYSVYLVHWPLISLFRYWAFRDPTSAEIAALLGASLLAGAIMNRTVERPFHVAPNFKPMRDLSLAVLSSLLVLGLCAPIFATAGLPQRISEDALLEGFDLAEELNNACRETERVGENRACVFGQPG